MLSLSSTLCASPCIDICTLLHLIYSTLIFMYMCRKNDFIMINYFAILSINLVEMTRIPIWANHNRKFNFDNEKLLGRNNWISIKKFFCYIIKIGKFENCFIGSVNDIENVCKGKYWFMEKQLKLNQKLLQISLRALIIFLLVSSISLLILWKFNLWNVYV